MNFQIHKKNVARYDAQMDEIQLFFVIDVNIKIHSLVVLQMFSNCCGTDALLILRRIK